MSRQNESSRIPILFSSHSFSFPLISWIYALLLLVFFPSSLGYIARMFVCSFVLWSLLPASTFKIHFIIHEIMAWTIETINQCPMISIFPLFFLRNHLTFRRLRSPLHLTSAAATFPSKEQKRSIHCNQDDKSLGQLIAIWQIVVKGQIIHII